MDIDLLAVIIWLIWGRRNSARLGESVLEYHQIQAKAELYLLDFKIAQQDDRRLTAAVIRAPWWIPPIPNHFKVNLMGLSSRSWMRQVWEWSFVTPVEG